jgi:signal transduction histidine kinase
LNQAIISALVAAVVEVPGEERAARLGLAREELALAHQRLEHTHGQLEATHEQLEEAHARLARTHADLAGTHAELRATSALLARSTQAAERLRISRDLHDLVGHQLTALALELEVASHDRADRVHVERARDIAKELLRDVRAAGGELRSGPPELEPALRELVRDLPGLRVELTVDQRVPVDDELASTIIRSAQEVVTNTLRHAAASTLSLEVVANEDGVRLDAVDDGRGAVGLVPGNGLRGLCERVEGHGGEVAFHPRGSNGSGFAISARLPAQASGDRT